MAGALTLGGGGLPDFPPMLQAVLLAAIGVFHMQLAAPSWRKPGLRPILLFMGGAALVFQSMLAVLVAGLAALLVYTGITRRWPATSTSASHTTPEQASEPRP